MRLWSMLLLAAATVATALLVGAGQAAAATVSVYCPGGDLQNAIDTAPQGATIVIYGTCYGNFLVDGTNATNFGQLTLQGGSARATLNGRGSGRTLYLSQATVTIRNLTITNGNANDAGGLLLYQTDLTMTNSTVKGNRAGSGAGMSITYSDVDLTGVTITKNTAEDSGGGIDAIVSSISITASTISQNKVTTDNSAEGNGGGGLRFTYSDLLLTNTRVTANSANLGGGIADWGGTSSDAPIPPDPLPGVPAGLTLVNSSVDHNTARREGGGGIFSASDLADSLVTLQGTTVSFNNALNESDGGGIKNIGTCDRTAMVLATGSPFQGNQAVTGKGGAVLNVSATYYCLGGGPGTALMTIAQSPAATGPTVVNSNQAMYGGGFANVQYGGVAGLTLQPGATVKGNKASKTGGGVWNDCGSFSSLAQIFLNTPNNVVQTCDQT